MSDLSYLDYAMRVNLENGKVRLGIEGQCNGCQFSPELMVDHGVNKQIQNHINKLVLHYSQQGVKHFKLYRLWSLQSPHKTCWEALVDLIAKENPFIPEVADAILTDWHIYVRSKHTGLDYRANNLLPFQQYASKWSIQDDVYNTHPNDPQFFHAQTAVEPYLLVAGKIGYLVGIIPQGDRMERAQEKLNEAIER